MRRYWLIGVAALLVAAFATTATAERRRRRPAPPPPEEVTPTSPQISADMGDIQWGWGHKQLLAYYTKEMRKLYQPVLAKAGGAIEEDRLRREMEARVGRVQKSYVEFTGQRTGWDASLIRDQYTHNNGEALVEVQELRAGGAAPRFTDYFFFINDHMWKRYRAFNQDQFSGLSFDEAAAVFEKRYGKARPVYETSGGTKRLTALEWQDDTTTLRAVDNTHFYGVLCLVYSERATASRIDELRTHREDTGKRLNPLVEALGDTSGDGDVHEDVVEHITGKRYKTAMPREGVKVTPSKGRPPAKSGGTVFDEPSPSKGRPTGGNPLDDLDI